MLSDAERQEVDAELARRRRAAVTVAVCLALATLIALVALPLWAGALVAAGSAVVVAMVRATHKQVLEAVRKAGY